MTDKILIEVYGGTNMSGGWSCTSCGPDASCGPSTPMNELVDRLAGELNASYGEKVEVKYIDTDPIGLDEFPVIGQVIQAGYPFPITSINGQPRFAGAINLDSIKQLLEELDKKEQE